MQRPRVLVVDDSAFARTVLARMLRAHDIDVVATARDGDDALERIAALDPDVVTLDLTMPGRDGLDVLRELGGRARPRVIVVSISDVDTERGAEALTLGAIDLVAKPTALASDRLHEITDELVAKVLAASLAPPVQAIPGRAVRRITAAHAELVMIGTSTGGPQALSRVISALPQDLRAPVAVVLHIPAGFTEALAQRLDRSSAIHVVEAVDGLEVVPGVVVIARGGSHLRIHRRGGTLRAEVSPLPVRLHVPSVDELLLSGADAVGAGALGIVLTGMGNDGLEGARAIAAVGGTLITESAATCVVYGMPRSIDEAALGSVSVRLEEIAQEIIARV